MKVAKKNKKNKKKHNPNRWIYYDVKLTSYCQILIHIYFHTVLSEKTNTKYNLTRHLTWMIPNDLYIWKLTCRCVFLNKREVLSRFIGKSNIFKYVCTCQIRSYDFWIMNTMCTFMYLFVVYISFAPVISASIHRYVNYFEIQLLMIVTETETVTSTWCSRRMTKRSSPSGSGRRRMGVVIEGYKVVALLLEPSLGLFGLVGWRQGLPPATWLHQGITTLFSTSGYTLVLTFKPTSKIWGGMMWPSLETRPKNITVAGNFVFITLGTSLLFVAIQICILRVLAMVLLS